jgi:hypothetical protein
MSKQRVARPQSNGEQHCAHPGRLAEQARETVPDPDPCADSGQQRIAGAGGSGDNRCERHEGDYPGLVLYDFHASLRRFGLWPPAFVMRSAPVLNIRAAQQSG